MELIRLPDGERLRLYSLLMFSILTSQPTKQTDRQVDGQTDRQTDR